MNRATPTTRLYIHYTFFYDCKLEYYEPTPKRHLSRYVCFQRRSGRRVSPGSRPADCRHHPDSVSRIPHHRFRQRGLLHGDDAEDTHRHVRRPQSEAVRRKPDGTMSALRNRTSSRKQASPGGVVSEVR